MKPEMKNRLARIRERRIQRAKELVAYADVVGITIGWDGPHTTFHPANGTDPKFIEEVTLLSAEIKAIKEGRV